MSSCHISLYFDSNIWQNVKQLSLLPLGLWSYVGWEYLTMPQNTVFLQLTQSTYVTITAICCLSSEELGKKKTQTAFKGEFNTKTQQKERKLYLLNIVDKISLSPLILHTLSPYL